MKHLTEAEHAELIAAREERDRLKAMINSPELHRFLLAVRIEAIHQVERWGTAHDRAKRPADWFWLVGYLAGKALHAVAENGYRPALRRDVETRDRPGVDSRQPRLDHAIDLRVEADVHRSDWPAAHAAQYIGDLFVGQGLGPRDIDDLLPRGRQQCSRRRRRKVVTEDDRAPSIASGMEELSRVDRVSHAPHGVVGVEIVAKGGPAAFGLE